MRTSHLVLRVLPSSFVLGFDTFSQMLTRRLSFNIVASFVGSGEDMALFPVATIEKDFAVLLVVPLHVPAEQAVRSEERVDRFERSVCSFWVDCDMLVV